MNQLLISAEIVPFHYQKTDNSPVLYTADGGVYLTRHHDCLRLLSEPIFQRHAPHSGLPFSANDSSASALERMISQWMVFSDPPDHSRLRRAFSTVFSTRSVTSLEPMVTAQVEALIGILPRNRICDVVEDFAFQLPVRVMCVLLGVPLTDIARIHAWATALTHALDTGSAEALTAGERVTQELNDYFATLIEHRHELNSDCLINSLASYNASELSAIELRYGCIFLLWAGHETTKNWLASGLLLLAQHPDQLARLQAQPELMERAINEMLRFDSPLQKISRWTITRCEFSGHDIAAGTLVTALLGVAHRDPSVFAAAERFDIGRQKNPHLAFGAGIHHCLGIWLARLEARVAFTVLVSKIRQLEVVDYRWRDLSAFRSLDFLHMKIDLSS